MPIFERRRIGPSGREVTQACTMFLVSALALPAISVMFEFTWRYQLPALVTLPRAQIPAESLAGREPELAPPAQGS